MLRHLLNTLALLGAVSASLPPQDAELILRGGQDLSPSPTSGNESLICRYNSTLSFDMDDGDDDHCCECFHSTCYMVDNNCALTVAGTNLFNYYRLQYCALGDVQWVSYVLLAIITIIVFSLLGTTADNFFVVQLETLSDSLKLSPSTAAITLLALGNSAPDVFSDLAAVQSNDDFPLALGELMGASMFLTTVVLAAVIFYATAAEGAECKVDKTPIRDILSFAIVLIAVFVFADSESKITGIEAICLIGAYIVYVACVIIYTKRSASQESPLHRMSSMFMDDQGSFGTRKSIQDHLLHDQASSINTETELEIGNATRIDYDDDSDGEDGEEEELVGIDWDSDASTFEKVTFFLEYPVSILRWLSIPGADKAWSKRRRYLSCFAPLGAVCIIFLDFSPNWTGGTPYDGFDLFDENGELYYPGLAFYITLAVSAVAGLVMFFSSNNEQLPSFNWVFVGLAFFSTVAWLDLLGNECVAVLESLGTITGLTSSPQGHSILGVTLLSWANSIGDLIADTAVTRAGKCRFDSTSRVACPFCV